jgi:predicted dehydrogenase
MVETLRSKPASCTSPVRVALIGYGYWGSKVHAALEAHPDFTVTHLHVRHPEELTAVQHAALRDVEVSSSAEAIWSDPAIRAVAIVSPIDTHYTLCKAALESGKHVLVEKPLCLASGQATELASIANSQKLTLQTDYTWTFSPGLLRAQQLKTQGWLGQLRSIKIGFRQKGRFRKHGVGPLLLVHMLSIVQMFTSLDELKWELVSSTNAGPLVTAVTVAGVHSDGLQVTLDASLNDPVKSRSLSMLGTAGALGFHPLASGPTLTAERYARSDNSDYNATEVTSHSFTSDESNNLSYAISAFANVLTGERSDNLNDSMQITGLLESLFSTQGAQS